MTRRDEEYLFDSIDQIMAETHENRVMLKQIISVLNYWLSHASQENDHDFGRNVLANLISNLVELRKLQ